MRQQDAYPTNAGDAVKTMGNTRLLFKGNISVADCMPLSSLLKTITRKLAIANRSLVSCANNTSRASL